tara:strand:+ start:369 stop:896 length:528 start_codon:yes stop_codon:yes gene_type:complete
MTKFFDNLPLTPVNKLAVYSFSKGDQPPEEETSPLDFKTPPKGMIREREKNAKFSIGDTFQRLTFIGVMPKKSAKEYMVKYVRQNGFHCEFYSSHNHPEVVRLQQKFKREKHKQRMRSNETKKYVFRCSCGLYRVIRRDRFAKMLKCVAHKDQPVLMCHTCLAKQKKVALDVEGK